MVRHLQGMLLDRNSTNIQDRNVQTIINNRNTYNTAGARFAQTPNMISKLRNFRADL